MPSGETRKYSDQDLIAWGKKLIDFIQSDETVCHVSDFELKHSEDLYIGWCKDKARTREVFYPVYKRAKALLGNRILKRAFNGHIDRWMISTLTPYYLSDIDDYLDSKIKRKIELEAESKAREGDRINAKGDALIDSIDGFTEAEDGKASK